jgi:F-type H+-transporting ATPase subunit delta
VGEAVTTNVELRAGPVAARYANALFQLARERGQLEAVARDVAALTALLARPADSDWIFDARVAAKDKRERIERLAQGFSPIGANFVRLIADKRRLDLLRELPAAFKRCALEERGAVEGVVESARPMGAGELAEMCVSLGALLHKTVSLEARVTPELIAGARIMVDNRMLDVSAQGRLEELRTKLNSARLN